MLNLIYLDLNDLFVIDNTKKYLTTDLEFYSCFPDDHTKFNHFVSALADTKLRTSKLNFVLSKDDFVEAPHQRVEAQIAPIRDALKTGFIRSCEVMGDGVTPSTYSGGILYDKMHGYGKRTDPDGSIYEGFYQNGVMHGYMKISTNGSTLMQYYSSEVMHGLRTSKVGNTPEYSLYENGEQIATFTAEQAEMVNNGDKFWLEYFKEQDSENKIGGDQRFLEPTTATLLRDEVQFRIACIEPEGPKLNPILEMLRGDGENNYTDVIEPDTIPADFMTGNGIKYYNK